MKKTDRENELILVTDKNFDEKTYLASNPDVAQAVREDVCHQEKYILNSMAEKKSVQ